MAALEHERWQVLRYLVAGAFNTFVSYGGYALGLAAELPLATASLIGLLAGVGVGFVSQGRFTFRSRAPWRLPRFLLAWAVMYGVHLSIVVTLQPLGVNPYAGGAAAVVVITALSYFVLRDWVFRPPPPATPGGVNPYANKR